MIRQPFGVWETGGALHEVEVKAFCQAPLKGGELIGACWVFLLSNSVERTFCFMCILTLYPAAESAPILICFAICASGNRLPEVHSATFGV